MKGDTVTEPSTAAGRRMLSRTEAQRECDEVCTSGCHASDCEHHGHLQDEGTGHREALLRIFDLAEDRPDIRDVARRALTTEGEPQRPDGPTCPTCNDPAHPTRLICGVEHFGSVCGWTAPAYNVVVRL